MIKVGQIYQSLSNRHRPVDGPVRIKVVGVWNGYNLNIYERGKATVVTVTKDGRDVRRRSIEMSQLHSSAVTKNGSARKTGYVLVSEG